MGEMADYFNESHLLNILDDEYWQWQVVETNKNKKKLLINKLNVMQKSKVEKVESCKPFTNNYGTTYYHNLVMENGDKINIGKKKQLAIGEELTYEIVEQDGNSEYVKAKTPKPQQTQSGGKNDDYVKGIEVGHAINNAVNLMCAGVELDIPESAITTEQKIYFAAKQIMVIANKLKSE